MSTLRPKSGARRWATTVVAVITALLCLAPPPVTAAAFGPTQSDESDTGDGPVLVVMDVSSSMTEDAGNGASRMQGAKDAAIGFIRFVRETAPGTRLGLRTYPSPSAACDAGRSNIAISVASSSTMDREIRGLSPEGDTPTGLALQQSGVDLQRAGGGGTILLVSDGESNCEGDSPPPCDVAADLAADGITINTIGFQISDEGKSELECIANATGGTYVDAADASELQDEFKRRAVPTLDVMVSHESRVAITAGSDNTTTITTTVQNVGGVDAPVATDVQATIEFDTDIPPGKLQPRRRLGNMAPGDKLQVFWSFSPPDEFSQQTISFTVTVVTQGADPLAYKGSIEFLPENDLKGIPRWMSGANNIVVMGDSYSSGEGVAWDVERVGQRPLQGVAFDRPTDSSNNICHRSNDHNYGARLAEKLRNDAKVTTLACSGAVTTDFFLSSDSVNPDSFHTVDGTKGATPLPAQLDQLEDLETPPDLIVLTVGGNDVGFEALISHCVIATNCAQARSTNLKTGEAMLSDGLTRANNMLPYTYASVALTAEKAAGRPVPVLVLAYPAAFPLSDAASLRCQFAPDVFGRNRAFINRVALSLNDTIAKNVAKTAADGWPVAFVGGTESAFQAGHTHCDREPWINKVTRVRVGQSILAELFENPDTRNTAHPNLLGYQAMGDQTFLWGISDAAKNLDLSVTKKAKAARALPTGARSVRSTVDLSAGDGRVAVEPGAGVIVRGSGFQPWTVVELHLASEPEPVAYAIAGADGSFARGFVLRKDFPTGGHDVVAVGVDPAGSQRELRRPIGVEEPLPTWWLPLLIGAGVLFVAGIGTGLAAWRVSRRDVNRRVAKKHRRSVKGRKGPTVAAT